MMRILFDATPYVPGQLTGAGRLVYQEIAHLAEIDRESAYRIFGFAPRIWPPDTLPDNFHYRAIKPWRVLGPLAQETARRVHVRTQAERYRFDVVHCTLDMVPVYEEGTKVLFSLYDLARLSPHFLYSTPQDLRSMARTQLRYRLAKRADVIHTISQYSAERIAAHLRLDRRRVRVIYPGADPLFCPGPIDHHELARLGLVAGRFFLFVGQFGRQKNEVGLVKAFFAACREGGLPGDMRLALVGDPAGAPEALRHLLETEPCGGRVTLTGPVADRDLLHLYRGAVALVLPSFYEGFGLPVVEAMACGTIPVVSRATSLPEVVGDAGLIVSAGHEPELAEALYRVANDAALREVLAARVRDRAAQFTFRGMAARLLDLYREMADA